MKKVLVIYGPTATGKTDLAIDLAKKYDGEVISADSRQVYRGLDIGTGKVSFVSKIKKHKGHWIVNGVKIHGFDLVDPGATFTVADFLDFAKSSIAQIIKVQKLPIIVGGAGFYIKALIEGIDTVGIKPDQDLRQRLEKLSTEGLFQKLLEIEPKKAQSMNKSDRENPRRLIRTIEIATYSQKQETRNLKREATSYQLPATNYLLVGLTAPNDYLYKRADKWLEARLGHGMIGEVKTILDWGVSSQWLDNLGLEYRWVSRYLKKEVDYKQMVARLKGDIHSFVRRQKTWFNKLKNIKPYDISLPNWREQIEKMVDLLLFAQAKNIRRAPL